MTLQRNREMTYGLNHLSSPKFIGQPDDDCQLFGQLGSSKF